MEIHHAEKYRCLLPPHVRFLPLPRLRQRPGQSRLKRPNLQRRWLLRTGWATPAPAPLQTGRQGEETKAAVKTEGSRAKGKHKGQTKPRRQQRPPPHSQRQREAAKPASSNPGSGSRGTSKSRSNLKSLCAV